MTVNRRAQVRGGTSGLRILALVTDAHGGFGGISQYNRDCIDTLCSFQSVAEVHVLPRVMPETLDASLDRKLIYDVEGAGGPAQYAIRALRYAWSLGPIDLVYCAHINFIPVAALVASVKRAPLVLAVYGKDVWKVAGRLPPSVLKNQVSCVVSISEITRDRFLAWCDIPRERIFLVPNAIRLEHYGAGPKDEGLLERLGLKGRTVLMTLGRMSIKDRHASKGFDRMIRALPSLIADVPNIAYLMVGDGTERPLLEAQAAQMGLQDRVVFAGRVSDEDKSDFYRLADAFVMPSVGDGFGFVVLEALACGVPVVASARDGTREAVRGGELGIIVDPFDESEIRRGILAALQMPRGVPEGLAYFTYDRFAQRLRTALASVCDI
ncbi:glycosyltransferase family 4 protein [Methylocystis sp.]|uniref:glycosyltransferase family 4 protein n=1 Tax=Methylocystis sp. TaxID=1911079 RepID=UPI003DA281C7